MFQAIICLLGYIFLRDRKKELFQSSFLQFRSKYPENGMELNGEARIVNRMMTRSVSFHR